MKGKIEVAERFRTNELSQIKTSNKVIAHYVDGHRRSYNNVHYPDKFIMKMFSKNPDIVKATVSNESGSREITRTN